MGIPIISGILGLVNKTVDKLLPDKTQAAKLKHELSMTIFNSDLAQMEINKEEAKHTSIFVSGWRPFVGWVCGFGLALEFIIMPVAAWAVAIWGPDITLPKLETGELITLLMGMLGMGMLRTLEKKQGTARHK